MTYAPSVTIAIVNYNTRDALRECLKSIERVCADEICPVIVVDNASVDGSPAMLKQEFPDVQVIQNSENIGFARAINAAFESVNTDYFMLLNPDTWVAESALIHLLKVAESNPKIAVVGAQLTSFEGELQPSVLSPPTLTKEFLNLLPELKSLLLPSSLKRRLHRNRLRLQGDIIVVPAVSGGAMLVRTSAFRSVNGFDPHFFVYHEEVDLCLRLRQAGWEIAFAPLAQVLHHDALATGYKSENLPSEPVLTWRLSGIARLFEKHASPSQHKRFIRMAQILLRSRARLARMRSLISQSSSAKWREHANELEIAADTLSKPKPNPS